ncbi:biotinidase-like [Eleginops maclovinus]|uniref:biotinidase-like n=1 Tax=Eleginops maclovinus TaxID=56733 RepID=UPI00307FEBD1
MFLIVVISFSLSTVVVQMEPNVDSSYIAAVYEHNVIQASDPVIPVSRSDALRNMQKNLDIYEVQAAKAAKQDVQILVFPEAGILGFLFTTRLSIFNYLETIPDPQKESWNPCTELGKYNNTEVLQRLSCMARNHNIYLVANMGDLQPCPMMTDLSSSCPPDGHWQFNTNVVFRSDGLLVARYHKQHLYREIYFDPPPKPEIITFDTPFAGKFGLITCFDIIFYQPTIELIEKGVRQLIFPTGWLNTFPFLDSVQFQSAFSLGANVTLLAANLRKETVPITSGYKTMTGSGIYTPDSATYHHAQKGDPEEGKLLVASVPVPQWVGQNVDTEKGSVRAPKTVSSVPPSSSTFHSSVKYDPLTFVLLTETEGKVNVCNGTFCCHLQYRLIPQGDSNELYALGAFAGKHNERFFIQVCALIRCAGNDVSSCGQEVLEAESKFDFVLEGTFGTTYVYPSVLASRFVLE